jgi:hypothetical protein
LRRRFTAEVKSVVNGLSQITWNPGSNAAEHISKWLSFGGITADSVDDHFFLFTSFRASGGFIE